MTMTLMTILKYKEKYEMMQLIKGDCLKAKVEELSYITKVNFFMDNLR